jgi:glycosyltransferase involved in cell wall biosynthesis
MAKLLISQYLPRELAVPCTIIPNWERVELFPPDSQAGGWTDSLAPQLESRFVILYLGNAGYGHEFQTMIDAAQKLCDEPVTFLFVGGGSQFDWIRNQSQQRGLTNILLHPYVAKSETPSVMRSADCALITLENYALGVMSPSKLHANLAMGLPVIYVGPAGGNVDEAIRRFGCGVSVRPGEAEALAAAIRAIISKPAEHQSLRRRARSAFEQAYCDLRNLARFDAVIDQVCSGR